METDFGAFTRRIHLRHPTDYPGLTFTASDVFDIKGYVTGFGNPNWERTHQPATRTSDVVTSVLEHGATFVGKSVVADMALSITGENWHYGTPINPAAPERIPGGASSGASVAVAAKLADFSLGIDTDGGVRVPASFCGVYGFRPSHGLLSLTGVIPVSESLDTVGFFASDRHIFYEVGCKLFPFPQRRSRKTFIIADDCFQISHFPADYMTHVVNSIERVFRTQTRRRKLPSFHPDHVELKRENLGDYLKLNLPSLVTLNRMEPCGDGPISVFTLIAQAMKRLKSYEFWKYHSEWTASLKSTGQVVETRGFVDFVKTCDTMCSGLWSAISSPLKLIEKAGWITHSEVEICHTVMSELRSALSSLLENNGILVMPTCINPPLKLGAKHNEDYLIGTVALSSLASMSGCCEAVIPLGVYNNVPVSLSLLASHECDRYLVEIMYELCPALEEEITKPSSWVLSLGRSAKRAHELGINAFQSEDWQEAVACHTNAIKFNASNPTYYYHRAEAYLKLGSYREVEDDCTKAIELDEKSVKAKAYMLRGTVREKIGKYREAKEDFDCALVLEGTNTTALKTSKQLASTVARMVDNFLNM